MNIDKLIARAKEVMPDEALKSYVEIVLNTAYLMGMHEVRDQALKIIEDK